MTLRGFWPGFLAVLAVTMVGIGEGRAASDDVAAQSAAVIFGNAADRRAALDALEARGDQDAAAAIILALRYRREATAELSTSLEKLTGAEGFGWGDWMVWQEANPAVKPHASFTDLKLQVLQRLDPEFLRFFGREWVAPEKMKIRLEEATWGGVEVDGIPSLDNPELIAAGDADYMLDDDLVFGVEINGDARAYPLRIMGWHEMFNEVIGGVPVALAYCTLCGSGILFETQIEGRDAPLVFGSSGLLYRSNKLMFDRETHSLWNQFTGEPVVGPLVDSGLKLKIRPVVITSWAAWRAAHQETRILSLETGHRRDYGSGVVYAAYFSSPELMFPAVVNEERLRQKDYVFGIRNVAAAKAWPIEAFAGGAVINDAVGLRDVVLLGDAATRTVRAYDRGGRVFEAGGEPDQLQGPGGRWLVEEEGLVGPDGTRLARVPGHIAYWFAWDSYLGVRSELYEVAN